MKKLTDKFLNLTLIALVSIGLLAALPGCGPATDTSVDSNLPPKDLNDAAAGGFVWGHNDPKTGKHDEELTDKAIIKRQEEVLKRQQEEAARLEREKQDVLRQKYHNEVMKTPRL